MSKYIQLSRYYFSDKDMADVLNGSEFTERALLQLGRQRGIFFSQHEKKAKLVQSLSRLPCDWDCLTQLADRLNSEEKGKKQSSMHIGGVADLDAVNRVLEEVKEQRGTKRGETYSIIKKNDTTYEVSVAYVIIDTSKARAFQRTEAHSVIELEKVGESLEVNFSHDERSREIVQALFDKLRESVDVPISKVDIQLTGVRDPALRTQFFLTLRQKMSGFRPVDVVDLAFDRRFPESDQKPEEDAQPSETSEKAEIKAMVKKASFSGEGLLSSELTNKLRETGYYIAKMRWSARETAGEARLVEFESGFGDAVAAAEFFYDVHKVYPRDDPADQKRTQAELLRSERPRLRRLVSDGAFLALQELNEVIAKPAEAASESVAPTIPPAVAPTVPP